MESNKRISDVREYFRNNYSYVNIGGISDKVILDYLSNGWVLNVPFERKMDLLYDYILSNDLTEIEE
jgi:hypothetical protein